MRRDTACGFLAWEKKNRRKRRKRIRRVSESPCVGTWSVKQADGGGPGLVVARGESAALGNTPRVGLAVVLLSRVIHLHVGGSLRQVLTEVTQTILRYLNGIEITLRTPLR